MEVIMILNASAQSSMMMILVYVVLFGGIIYFMTIRPQRREKKAKEELYSAMQPGDSVLTTSGFYGVIIDIMDNTVIVEFGNNRNCRIPMQKDAIAAVEKPNLSKAEEE
jgi:preprotein translocase subunit YajC